MEALAARLRDAGTTTETDQRRRGATIQGTDGRPAPATTLEFGQIGEGSARLAGGGAGLHD